MACEIVIEKRRVCVSDTLILDYMLSKRKAKGGLFLYSLLIEESCANGREFVFLDALTADEAEARRLWKLFSDETVTPCTAEDVLYEVFYAP